jgi:hypothetical protein
MEHDFGPFFIIEFDDKQLWPHPLLLLQGIEEMQQLVRRLFLIRVDYSILLLLFSCGC